MSEITGKTKEQMSERVMRGNCEKEKRRHLHQTRQPKQALLKKQRVVAMYHQTNLLMIFEDCDKRSGRNHKKGEKKQVDKNTWHPAPLLRGRIIKAEYNDPRIPDYQNNPLNEALPPIWSKEQVIDMLQYYPDYQEAHREWPPELRLHLIRNVLKFFEVIPMHI